MKLANITSQLRGKFITEVYHNWLKSSQEVLDIGCGTGIISEYLSNKLKIRIVGCDIDNYLIKKIPFILMTNSNLLPFKNHQFSAAMFNDVLHHTEYKNQIKLLKESLRVAKKVLIFEVYPTFSGLLFDYLLNKIHNPQMSVPFTFRKTKEWEKVFKRLKVKYQTIEVKRPFFYPFSHIAFYLEKKR